MYFVTPVPAKARPGAFSIYFEWRLPAFFNSLSIKLLTARAIQRTLPQAVQPSASVTMASKTPPASSGSVSAIARLQLPTSGNGDEVVRRSIKPDNGADGGADGQTVHASDGHPGIFCDKEGR